MMPAYVDADERGKARSKVIIPACVGADEGGEARSQGEDTRSCYVNITNPEKKLLLDKIMFLNFLVLKSAYTISLYIVKQNLR